MSKYHNIKQWTVIITTSVFITTILASCTKNFEKINTPYVGAAVATLPQLFTSIGANLDATAEGEDNTASRWLYPITQLGAVYAASDYGYGGGANWNGFYQNLAATNNILDTISRKPDSSNYTNFKAMVKVLRAYQAIELSNFYGDMPYSKAGKGFSGNVADLTAPYDKQQQIYISCLNDLTWAVNNFDATSTTQYSIGSVDFLLKNDIAKWIEFANALRLRYALTMYDKDNATAGPIIADAMAKLTADPLTDVVGLSQENIPGISFDLGGGGRAAFFRQESRARMGSTLWNLFSDNNNADGSGIFDLRAKIFFEVNGNGDWVPYPQNPVTPITDGGDPYNTGRDLNWSDPKYLTGDLYSNYNYYWGRDGNIAGSAGAIPEIFISPAEVHFLRAEAYARGAGVGANPAAAQTEYVAGVTSSLTYWNSAAFNSSIWVVNKPATAVPSDAAINLVLNNSKVAWNADNALSLIYAQEWIDLFRQPWVAWTLLRRTGGATPMDQTNPAGYKQNYSSLQRYQYPADEKQYNYANWQAATGGSDLTSTKIWIAK